MQKDKYDAVVVGSGPNGLAAAICLRQAGLSVVILEGKCTIGGGLRSAAFLQEGYIHDICSAIQPLALQSPYFKTLPLERYGLHYIHPPVLAAHPLDQGETAALYPSLEETARSFGADKASYLHVLENLQRAWPALIDDVLAPFHFPKHPIEMFHFGRKALLPATRTVDRFSTPQLRALWGGMAAHAMLPLSHATTSAVAMVLMLAGHSDGWPVIKGGSQQLAIALGRYFQDIGGEIVTDYYVDSLQKLPHAQAVLFDLGPRQLLRIAGHRFSKTYRSQLNKYKYGMGVFKMDWILSEPIPFLSDVCRKAGTVHLGNTFEEIAFAEQAVWRGQHPDRPFVLLAQQSLFDDTRTKNGHQVAWAYCHVPNGSRRDMSLAIENQIERFAPGFKSCILAKRAFNTQQMEAYNPNYVGGDINGGMMDIGQLFTRPSLRLSPYKTSAKGLYICSSSTPPGGGVHGMCGFYAAKKALKEIFGIKV